ncbi:LysR family substrate-binding domain-containing protein [Actinophytocola glycyrrhizae]|uniref:LysR family substrate-binding domain-containing protein n=1 Tax=Actinophytocola glycyrrhizae TaxID=2044873 RepID=A0ABV9RTT7_9PSEU
MTGQDVPPSFTLGYVPGVTPAKWVRTWQERVPDVPLNLVQVPAADAACLVRDGAANAVLLRLPVDRTGLHAIPLYTETTVLVMPKDHHLAAADELTCEDVADSVVLQPLDDTLDWAGPPGTRAAQRPASTEDAVELVAAGIGLLVVPQSLARLHHRKDLTYRPLTDVPRSGVALSWQADETTDLMEEFIGIVRGRTVNSSRGRRPERAEPQRTEPREPRGVNDTRRRQGTRSRKPRRR